VLSPFAAEYARIVSGNDPGFVPEIDPADEMFGFGLRSLRGSEDAAAILYFSVGRLIADSLGEALAWRFPDRPPASLLDFAAGYGRATRFLARRLASTTVTAAEIDPAALAFQAKALGVPTLLSPPDADAFDPARGFDAVVASSFFSHLSESRFGSWLGKLWDVVRPGGLLVFSTHGRALLSESADWSREIVFRATSETDRLDPDAYGTSWVTPEFVAASARRSCAGGSFQVVPFGLDGRQDLFAIARPPNLPPSPLQISPVPRGDLDGLRLAAGKLLCEGFLESPEEAEIVFLARDQERGRMRLASGSAPRRWYFEIELAGVSPDDVLRVEARTGRVRILAMGTLRPHL
jgi:SAM-dependent methyltransferase